MLNIFHFHEIKYFYVPPLQQVCPVKVWAVMMNGAALIMSTQSLTHNKGTKQFSNLLYLAVWHIFQWTKKKKNLFSRILLSSDVDQRPKNHPESPDVPMLWILKWSTTEKALNHCHLTENFTSSLNPYDNLLTIPENLFFFKTFAVYDVTHPDFCFQKKMSVPEKFLWLHVIYCF